MKAAIIFAIVASCTAISSSQATVTNGVADKLSVDDLRAQVNTARGTAEQNLLGSVNNNATKPAEITTGGIKPAGTMDVVKPSILTSADGRMTNNAQADVPAKVEMLQNNVRDHVEMVQTAVEDHVGMVQTAVEGHVDKVQMDVRDHVDMVQSAVEDHVDMVQTAVQDHVDMVQSDVEAHVDKVQVALKEHVDTVEANLAAHVDMTKAEIEALIGPNGEKLAMMTPEEREQALAKVETLKADAAKHVKDTMEQTTQHVEMVKEQVKAQVDMVKTQVTDRVEEVNGQVADRVEEVKTQVMDRVEEVKTQVMDRVEEVKTQVMDRVEEVRRAIMDLQSVPSVGRTQPVTGERRERRNVRWNARGVDGEGATEHVAATIAEGDVFDGADETARTKLHVKRALDGTSGSGVTELATGAPQHIHGKFGRLSIDANGKWSYDVDLGNSLVRAFAKRAGLLNDVFGVEVEDDNGDKKEVLIPVKLWENMDGIDTSMKAPTQANAAGGVRATTGPDSVTAKQEVGTMDVVANAH